MNHLGRLVHHMNHLVQLVAHYMMSLELSTMGLVPKMMDQQLERRTMNLELNFQKRKKNESKNTLVIPLVCEVFVLFEKPFRIIAEMKLIFQRDFFCAVVLPEYCGCGAGAEYCGAGAEYSWAGAE